MSITKHASLPLVAARARKLPCWLSTRRIQQREIPTLGLLRKVRVTSRRPGGCQRIFGLLQFFFCSDTGVWLAGMHWPGVIPCIYASGIASLLGHSHGIAEKHHSIKDCTSCTVFDSIRHRVLTPGQSQLSSD
ncbi:hypothetical protein BaRGS_00007138 [Batillaria attramentaria]|uniref:Uncharacterized protein n=1 Tax=Batillaria attramentaria TaxID=370345 RepID=A0ABD0LQH4_9CAEN